jgi:curved DNA-binding protein CbpA
VPRLIAGCDFTSLPLGAVEGFVLSRIDGATNVGEIVNIVALPADEVQRIVERLADLGAIELEGYVKKSPSQSSMDAVAPPPLEKEPAPLDPAIDAAISDDAPELAEPGDLDVATRKKILHLASRIDRVDFYDLLGVGRSSDRKAIKGAYYAHAALLHTDRYYGKSLGSFKSKMEIVFGRMTEAHDVLATPSRRIEYDQYLADQEQARAFEALLGDDAEPLVVEERVRENAVRSVDSRPRMEAVRVPISTPAPMPSSPPLDDRARREALARKLGRSSKRFPAVHTGTSDAPRLSTTPPVATSSSVPARPSGFVRRDEAIANARRAEAARHVTAGDALVTKGDFVGAANQYRIAQQHHADPAVQKTLDEATKKAKASMIDVYLKNAKYEEAQQRWGLAALSYMKAFDAKPEDEEIAMRAANALRREGRDLRRAAHLAEQAVMKSPNKVAYRLTLGNIYLDAGLFLRARSELETAARLAPQDAQIRELLSRAKKAAG